VPGRAVDATLNQPEGADLWATKLPFRPVETPLSAQSIRRLVAEMDVDQQVPPVVVD
jgi:hypothetical protein